VGDQKFQILIFQVFLLFDKILFTKPVQ